MCHSSIWSSLDSKEQAEEPVSACRQSLQAFLYNKGNNTNLWGINMLSKREEERRNQLDEAYHLRLTQMNKDIYAKRKETIERVFADAKEKHGMRWTKLRGLKKVSMQAMLTFAAMNLKKLANWTWKGPCPA